MNKLLPRTIIFLIIIFAFVLAKPNNSKAEQQSDWIIRDFQSEITVNKDSSLDIVEIIKADCGDLPEKHGIYRVIPYLSYGQGQEKFKTPITLKSITDENGASQKYEQANNRSDNTISWKIGDPNKTVAGVNNYIIKYHVENVIRNGDSRVDELYWNLNGNFWQIPIEKYRALVVFPNDSGLSSQETNLYAGGYGKSLEGVAAYTWDKNILQVDSLRTLDPGEGITISVTTPKNYFLPYTPGFWERYRQYFNFLIPLLALVLCFKLWKKYGRDPKINWTIAPEFEIPENLAPVEYGMVLSDGALKNNYLTAAIVALAVKKQLKISVSKEAGLMSQADYRLERIDTTGGKLSNTEQVLLEKIFAGSQSVDISSLKNKFYRELPAIEKSAMNFLVSKDWLVSSSKIWMGGFLGFGLVLLGASFVVLASDTTLAITLMATSIIILIFSPLMRHRTRDGAELLRRLKGFELYMKKAEKYRQQWLEHQNIFEEFLPYAIIYGIAKDWVKKLREIYGEEYFSTYHPIWFYGYAGNFDVGSFSDNIESMSHNMASTLSSTPSSSGSGGGGFSGGGGGGGGGGGW